jgi:methionyl-tRNA formyltransferase
VEILFFGTSEFAIPTLKLLFDSNWKLAGVVTQPDRPRGRGRKISPPPVKSFLDGYGLPIFQVEKPQELFDLPAFQNIRPNVAVVVAYGKILPPEILSFPPKGCVNLHPSLLPAYRGAAPIQRAIINGEKITGVTTMYLSSEMDAGDIILQEEVMIGDTTTYGELAELLAGKGAHLVLKTLTAVEQGAAPRRPQDHSRATYAPPLQPGDEKIRWEKKAGEVDNLIRGMNPRPGAYTFFKGKILKIWRAQVINQDAEGFSPGQIVDIDPKLGFTVQTGESQLLLKEVQPAGRARMSSADFLRGYRVQSGILLGE